MWLDRLSDWIVSVLAPITGVRVGPPLEETIRELRESGELD